MRADRGRGRELAIERRSAFVDGQFPQELYQLIFLLLSGPDLLAAALANPAWWHVIRSNDLWAKKAMQLWPGLASRTPRPRFEEAPAKQAYRWGPEHAHAEFPHLLLPHRSWARYVLERALAEEASLATPGGPLPDSLRALPFSGPFLGALHCELACVARPGTRLPNLRHAHFTNRQRAATGALLAALADERGLAGPGLTSLAICDEALTLPDLPALRRLLAARPALTRLDLTGNNLQLAGARAVADALGGAGRLAALQLASNGVGDDGALLVPRVRAPGGAGGLGAAGTLRTLDLSNNPVGRDGVLALAASLSTNPILTRLSLRYCGLLGNSQENIAAGKIALPALLVGPALTSLDLSYNDVVSTSYDRPEAILEALEGARALLSLNLERSSIGGWRRALAIARGLARSPSLTSVNLSCNWIASSSSGAPGDILSEYAAAFRSTRTLRRVGFAHNDLRAAGARLLVEAAAAGGTIEYLDLQHNAIGREGVAALVRFLEATTACATSGRCCRGMRALVHHPLLDGAAPGEEHALDVPVPAFERCACGRAPLQVNLCGNISLAELLAPAPRPGRPAPPAPPPASRHSPLPAFSDAPRLEGRAGPSPRPLPEAPGELPPGGSPFTGPGPVPHASALAASAGGARRGPWGGWRAHRAARKASGAPSEPISVILHDSCAPRRLPSPGCLGAENPRGINSHCRAILLDWLGELCEAFALPDEALCRAAHYTDRYTSRLPVSRASYQLVGAVALMLASNNFFSKLGMTDRTMQVPNGTILPRDIVYYSDDSYTQGEVMALEACMLQLLAFDLEHHSPFCHLADLLAAARPAPRPPRTPSASPTPLAPSPAPRTPPPPPPPRSPSPLPPAGAGCAVTPEMLVCAAAVVEAPAAAGPDAPVDDLVASLAAEVLRQCAREYSTLQLHPSLVAAAALFLSLRQRGLPWGEALTAASGYTERYLAGICEARFGFLRGRELRCPSLLERDGLPAPPAPGLGLNAQQPAPLALGAGAAFGTAPGAPPAAAAAAPAAARPKYTVVL
eukprot:tig00021432_g21240.t1